ncbi:MAG: hypothetical protein FJY85_14715, partial [Deltaproteobacteria bacterium]|nr:hypothetical protein [Deltaproteobacteria bacterium]
MNLFSFISFVPMACRPRKLVLILLVGLAALLLLAGLSKSVMVLEITNPELVLPVSQGDVLCHSYTHSMYEVPVAEKFIIQDGYLRLVHVMTQSEAALAYFGIEKKGEPNVDSKFLEFTIPAGSIGNHVLTLNRREIPLETREDRDGSIHVRLLKVPLLGYLP